MGSSSRTTGIRTLWEQSSSDSPPDECRRSPRESPLGRSSLCSCSARMRCDCGIPEQDLRKLESLVVTGILPNKTTAAATVLLPSASWAEKRGSMINIKGRLQRLNKAISSPGKARDDWEILRDLLQAVSGSNGTYTVDELFKQIAAEFPALEGLSLSRIGDLGVDLSEKLPPANHESASRVDQQAKDLVSRE